MSTTCRDIQGLPDDLEVDMQSFVLDLSSRQAIFLFTYFFLACSSRITTHKLHPAFFVRYLLTKKFFLVVLLILGRGAGVSAYE